MIIAFYGWIGLPFCAIYLYFVPYKYFVQLIFEENSNVTLKDKGTEKDDNIEENWKTNFYQNFVSFSDLKKNTAFYISEFRLIYSI